MDINWNELLNYAIAGVDSEIEDVIKELVVESKNSMISQEQGILLLTDLWKNDSYNSINKDNFTEIIDLYNKYWKELI